MGPAAFGLFAGTVLARGNGLSEPHGTPPSPGVPLTGSLPQSTLDGRNGATRAEQRHATLGRQFSGRHY